MSATAIPAQVERAAALRTYLAERLATDLSAFTKKAFQILYPGRKLAWSPHYDLLCEWWIKFYDRGIARRENSHSTDRRVAEKLLKKRLAEVETETYVSARKRQG